MAWERIKGIFSSGNVSGTSELTRASFPDEVAFKAAQDAYRTKLVDQAATGDLYAIRRLAHIRMGQAVPPEDSGGN